MKPYYAQDGITIYHGNCLDVLPRLRRGVADLIVTDPPYGVRWQSMRRALPFDCMAGDVSHEAAIEATRLALPLLRRSGHVYLFGRFDLSDLPLTEPIELIWDKAVTGCGDLESPWGKQHEYIQFAVYNISGANREDGAGRLTARLRKGSVLRYQRPNAVAVRHPSEKPVRLLRELIESSSCLGDVVLDYFAGIGSTLVAARLESREAIGIELEEKYCEVAAQRLQQGALDLFGEATA